MKFKDAIPMWLRYRLMDIRGRGIYSSYADKFRCIFIHIPKTAGTAIAQTLFEIDSRHIRYIEYEKANKYKFDQYYKFTFIRNPWDRLVSTYFFLLQGGLNEMDRQWAEQHLKQYENFEGFVCNWLTVKNINSWVHFRPQHYFICNDKFENQMDFTGRFETLEQDYNYVQKQLGVTRQLQRLNKSEHLHYSQYYTEQMRDIVSNIYEMDINIFDYQFEYEDQK